MKLFLTGFASACLLAADALAIDVPTLTLSNGVEMPAMAAGVGGDNISDASNSIVLALSLGILHVDAAHDYMNLEGVADALKRTRVARKDIFLTTKIPGCGVPTQGLQPPCMENTYKMASDDIHKLGTPYVDLLLIHFPPIEGCTKPAECTKIQQQWTAVEQLYAENKTRAIGVSNYCQACLECVMANATVTPMVDQMQFHVGMGNDPAGLRSYLKEHDIVHEGYSPLAHGAIFDVPEVAAVANATGKSAAQVGLRWIHEASSCGRLFLHDECAHCSRCIV
eukprot:INCI6127.1.p1 GENE.INCI6127.1~~INCI6127.1.p1  ORF type:complete len:281 (-),score=41.37 INCI6127.1:1446-2288(-)